MSAYLVSDETITGILSAIHISRYQGEQPSYYWNDERHIITSPRDIGQKLLDENHRSVTARYGEKANEHWPKRTYRILSARPVSPVEIIKLCDCYSYQACETNDWSETEAHAIVTALRERAITNLPGYEEAAWGF